MNHEVFFMYSFFVFCLSTHVNRFNVLYKENYLKYHTEPVSPVSLDPRVFTAFEDGRDPELLQTVRTQILRDIQSLNEVEALGVNTRIQDYVIVDSVLQPNAKDNCLFDILVQVNTANLHDVLKERLVNAVKELNKRKITGTNHFANYQLTVNKINPELFTYVYHPYYNKWLKKPRVLGN